FGDAEVRILPPQPASPSLTRTKADRARNAAISSSLTQLAAHDNCPAARACVLTNQGTAALPSCACQRRWCSHPSCVPCDAIGSLTTACDTRCWPGSSARDDEWPLRPSASHPQGGWDILPYEKV